MFMWSVPLYFDTVIISENSSNVDCTAKHKWHAKIPQKAKKPKEIQTSQGCNYVVLIYPLTHEPAAPRTEGSPLFAPLFQLPFSGRILSLYHIFSESSIRFFRLESMSASELLIAIFTRL